MIQGGGNPVRPMYARLPNQMTVTAQPGFSPGGSVPGGQSLIRPQRPQGDHGIHPGKYIV